MVLTLVMCCENGFLHRGWMVASLLHVYFNTLMFGLMVVWSRTILLELLLLGLVYLLNVSGFVGFVVGECIWTCYPFHAQLGVKRCSLYSSLPGLLQTLQWAEMWDGGGESWRYKRWPLFTKALIT